MNSKVSKIRTGLLLSAGALFLLGLATAPATAGFAQGSGDMTQLMGRINQLENQIQTLSRSVYRGAKPPANVIESSPLSSGGGDAAAAVYEDRLSQIEAQQRDMTGQLERLSYDVSQMKDRLDKTLADNEMRFQQMSGSGTAAASPSSYSRGGSSASTYNRGADSAATTAEGMTADALYNSAFSDLSNRQYDSAERKLKDFMSRYSTHTLAANAHYWLAETYYVRADYRQAAKIFAQNYQDYPQGPKAADSLLKLGMSLSKLGKKDDACLSFQQLKKQFPGDANPAGRKALQEMKTLGCG